MRICALVENTAGSEAVGAEHGLSLYIETARHRLLFDMGQTGLFAENAAQMGIDLAAVDVAVLSHGHYDHGGGLSTFLAGNSRAPVYVSRHAFAPHYHGTQKYIGLDPALAGHPRLIFTHGRTVIGQGLTLDAGDGMPQFVPLHSGQLTRLEDGAFLPEDFRHEQYLLIEEAGRRVLFSGCAHRGILNIAAHFRPDVLVGGFHLSKYPLDGTLDALARRLEAMDTVFYTGHCTGGEQFAYMRRRMERLHYLAAGDCITL